MESSATAKTFARKLECEEDGLYFNRYFFKQRFGAKMIISGHHHAMQNALDRTMLPPSDPRFISRLIINVPPRYSKTEMCSIGYIARGLLKNPASKYLHLSYSHKLALTNSATAREIVKSKAFQAMQPMRTKDDIDSKEIWHTTTGGSVTATSAGGQVTGFGAGAMDDTKFTGALIIDDPVNPKTAGYDAQRKMVNDQYNETIASRIALETVPIIVVMQRVHWDDLTGYLLTGGSGENWHHLDLPVILDSSEAYPEEYTHGVQIEHGMGDGWLWPFKHNASHEVALKAHRRRYWAQYRQRPIKRDEETALWTEKTLAKARELKFSTPVRTLVSVDPATTNKATSDHHGIGVASICEDPNQYIVEADYTIKGSPKDWAERAIMAHDRHDADAIVIEVNQGGDMCADTLRNAGFTGRIIMVHATKGKVIRAEPIAALYELGYVQHKAGLSKAEEEMLDFDPLTGLSNSKSPNRVDWIVWALTELSGGDMALEELLKLAMGET